MTHFDCRKSSIGKPVALAKRFRHATTAQPEKETEHGRHNQNNIHGDRRYPDCNGIWRGYRHCRQYRKVAHAARRF